MLNLVLAWEQHVTMATALLEDLAQRISRQESELQALRRELETRRRQLTNLTQRKQELLSQLRQIDEEIGTLAGGSKPGKLRSARSQNGTPPANGTKVPVRQVVIPRRASSPKAVRAQTKQTPSLPNLLLAILTEAARPMTVSELAKEAKRRGFRTKSKNFAKNVESRAYDLQKRGLIRHPEGRPGYELNGGARPTPARRAKQSKATGAEHGSASARSVQLSFAKFGGNRLPLHEVVTNILGKSQSPLPAGEVAKRVLASGYRTKSKDFRDVMWVTLGKLKNVENVPGIGWRLKRGRG
jgi:hypothetical protein